MPSITANGLEMGYDVDGDEGAPPLILLHGATSLGAEDWAAQRPPLAKTFRVYLPDARGHGRTRWDVADGWSNEMLVDDLLAFADALGIDRFDVGRVLDGRDDRAHRGDPRPGAAADTRRRLDRPLA